MTIYLFEMLLFSFGATGAHGLRRDGNNLESDTIDTSGSLRWFDLMMAVWAGEWFVWGEETLLCTGASATVPS